jgi:hypothetical protein
VGNLLYQQYLLNILLLLAAAVVGLMLNLLDLVAAEVRVDS